MTDNVAPIGKQRAEIDTGFRFHFAEFTAEGRDDTALYDSLRITLKRAAGLLDFIEEAMEKDSPKQAIQSAELECRDALAILEAWGKGIKERSRKAAEPA